MGINVAHCFQMYMEQNSSEHGLLLSKKMRTATKGRWDGDEVKGST